MEVKEWLEKVAYIGKSDIPEDSGAIYYSKYDDSYITRVDMEDNVKFLATLEITEELTHGVGFSPKDNKWYGWSHRAIYGFEVGSECRKGDCHYVASTPEELIDDHSEFFADISEQCAKEKRAECQILEDRSGIRILHSPVLLQVTTPSELINVLNDPDEITELETVDICENSCSVIQCGRGAWTAKTMEDAKQMAKDFNKGVS